MAERRVTASGKDEERDITALCNSGQAWSPRKKADAIRDIEGGSHSYYVQTGNKKVGIHVVHDPKHGKYLRTNPDETSRNNLHDLPDC